MIELSALNWLQLILFGALVGFGFAIGQGVYAWLVSLIIVLFK